MSLPLKLVEYLAQIKRTNTLTILLKYIELCQLYQLYQIITLLR